MRCLCCNSNLSDFEATMRHPVTNEFLDICKKCLKDIPISPIEGVNKENTDYSDGFEEEEIFDFWADDDE